MIRKVFRVIFFLFMIHSTAYSMPSQQEIMERADALYLKGERESTVEGRREAFNGCLNLYTSLKESLDHPDLYYNLANTYFQLEEYPFAIYYYYRTLKIAPRHDKALYNLNIALKKIGMKEEESDPVKRVLFFHHDLSTEEKLFLFFIFSLISFFSLSIYIWNRSCYIRKIFCATSSIAALAFLTAVWGRYVTEVNGVVVRPSVLHRDAGKQYAVVENEPLHGGTKVEVIEFVGEEKWMKIRTQKGTLGYVPGDSVWIF